MRLLTILLYCVVSTPISALCVQNEFANLRAGPSTDSEKTWKVFRYMPLKKLDKKDGWYKVQDLDGREHWIREDLVTSAYKCAVIKNEWAYLRSGPGRDYPKTEATKGFKYLSFRFLSKKGDWFHLEDSQGDELWIHGPLMWMADGKDAG